ncbi:hypothetical protein E3N88_41493 [Mikania micrantha]|uniref:Uncharacterized protein n=1 Tax=Mikania micrantha TaxID=192012 RepID=A0A5N6LQT7_9ASTR|nr:hypothetical protein E3N88_45703 [Mikania micrantha]KAD2394516.1 hypothetical protein E3N88_41493 [Mikania micrantha]
MDCNLQLLLMEIDLDEEENTETSKFINFSIREYVDEIRNKNPEKCWPFRSMGNRHKKVVSSYQSSESTFLSGTEITEAPNSSKVENFNGKEDLPKPTTEKIESSGIDDDFGKIVDNGSSELTFYKVNVDQNRYENNVVEGAKIGHNVTADNNEPGRTRPRRKHQKFRLLSDLYKDPASELRADYDRTNPENVNRKFVTEIDDEWDGVTLAAYFRKQKGVELDDSTLKKRNVIEDEKPSVDLDRKSNHESKYANSMDSNVGTSRKKRKTDETDTQTMPEHNKVTPSTLVILNVNDPQSSTRTQFVNRVKSFLIYVFSLLLMWILGWWFYLFQDILLQCSPKSNRSAEVSILEAADKEKENEDCEMEAVMLLARRFNEEKQILRELETNMNCACVKKKIRKHSTQSGNKSITKTSSKTARKHPVKKITKEKLENTFSVQRMCFIPVKATPSDGFQRHLQMSMTMADGVELNAQNCATLACSFNMNPADFSIPNGENMFMRGG